MVQDRAGAADGTSSATGVSQVTKLEQVNTKAISVSNATQRTPANGDIVADKVGVAIVPTAPLHVYHNTTGEYAAIIDQDEPNAGHGLKVTSDGNGAGTNVLEVESVSTSLLRVLGNGNVGIGVADGDITGDASAARTYVGIQGTANRGVLNIGSTAADGADTASVNFTNGANVVAGISVDSDSGSQTLGKLQFFTSSAVRQTIDSAGLVTFAAGIVSSAMPTSDPTVAGQLWNDSGTVKISSG
jgi:hypothetical protein